MCVIIAGRDPDEFEVALALLGLKTWTVVACALHRLKRVVACALHRLKCSRGLCRAQVEELGVGIDLWFPREMAHGGKRCGCVCRVTLVWWCRLPMEMKRFTRLFECQ